MQCSRNCAGGHDDCWRMASHSASSVLALIRRTCCCTMRRVLSAVCAESCGAMTWPQVLNFGLGALRPERVRSKVDLPVPAGPSRAVMPVGASSKLTSARMTRAPKEAPTLITFKPDCCINSHPFLDIELVQGLKPATQLGTGQCIVLSFVKYCLRQRA